MEAFSNSNEYTFYINHPVVFYKLTLLPECDVCTGVWDDVVTLDEVVCTDGVIVVVEVEA